MNKLELIWTAFACAVVGFTYSQVLTAPGEVLNGLWHWLNKRVGKIEWLFKPLIDCYRCVTGQLALWSSAFQLPSMANHFGEARTWVTFFAQTATTVCLAIFISLILNKIYNAVKEN